MIRGLLPVKSLSSALERLRPVLSPAERSELARTMYQVMLEKMLSAQRFDRVVVASSDQSVLDDAQRAGAIALEELHQSSHSLSADWAATRCAEMGARTLVIVPIDVPLATPEELDSLAEAANQLVHPSLVIVPSADGSGTNALVRTPPGIIASRFGAGSFEAHIAQAKQKALAVEVKRPPGIVFDLDTPEDLLTLGRYAGSGSESGGGADSGQTLTYLREINAFERAENYLCRRADGNSWSV